MRSPPPIPFSFQELDPPADLNTKLTGILVEVGGEWDVRVEKDILQEMLLLLLLLPARPHRQAPDQQQLPRCVLVGYTVKRACQSPSFLSLSPPSPILPPICGKGA